MAPPLFWEILSVVLALGYAGLMGIYFFSWKKLPPWPLLASPPATPVTARTTVVGGDTDNGHKSTLKLSVIIPARNEESTILNCLNSILENNYPPEFFEIIVIDDFSEDNTGEIVETQSNKIVRLIKLANELGAAAVNSFKKKAIEIGVKKASGELIITTDADCIVPKNWLSLLSDFYEQNRPRAIAAPVNFHDEKSLLERFQSIDFAGMMGITGAGIAGGWQHMANGANLLFEKKTFDEIGGYADIDGRASGDDMLLVQKIAARWPGSVAFLKNPAATVLTKAKPDWPSFFSQRLRWATKSGAYDERLVTAALALVWLFCVNLLVSAALGPILDREWGWVLLFQLTVKLAADWFFLREMTGFFGRRDLMRWFLPSFFLHVFYIAVVGTASVFIKKYEWKGRRVS